MDNPTPESPSPATATATDPLSNPYASLNAHCHELSTLNDLACRGAWRTIIDKVARARSLSLLTKPHEHLIYLSFNLLSLLKLRRFPDAHLELQTLDDDLDSTQYRFESYPDHYPTRPPGSMVPFALRFLHAYLPFTLGNRQVSLDRLYLLLNFIKLKKLKCGVGNVSLELWRKRESFVRNSVISLHLSQKEFKVCLELLKMEIGENEDPVLVSKLGYVQMHYGDLEGAKRSFELVERVVSGDGDGDGSVVGMRNLVGRNKALMYLVGKDYVSAVREYDECVERDGTDVVAVNNKALCLMYLRDLSDSIKVLENALERVPTLALNETLVVNLCSMYELAYVNHTEVKKTLSNWIARVAPDDFDTTCTRI